MSQDKEGLQLDKMTRLSTLMSGNFDQVENDGNEDETEQYIKKKLMERNDLAFLNKLMISQNSTWKGAFDILMLIVTVINIYTNAYLAAFEMEFKNDLWFILTDNIIELLFFIDMGFSFC